MDTLIVVFRIAPIIALILAPFQLGLSVYFLFVRRAHRCVASVVGVSAVGAWATFGALIVSDFPEAPDPDSSPFGALISYAVLVEHHATPYLFTVFGCGIVALVSTLWILVKKTKVSQKGRAKKLDI